MERGVSVTIALSLGGWGSNAILVGEALQFDGRPFTLFVEGIEQGNGVGQRPVQQQGDLAQGGAALTL